MAGWLRWKRSNGSIADNLGDYPLPVDTGGGVAPGSTESGNPTSIGGYASASAPTPVTTGQKVRAWFGLNGMQMVSLATGLNDTDDVVGIGKGKYPAAVTLQNAVSATGNGGSVDVAGLATALFRIAGTFTATVTWEGSTDDTDWDAIPAESISTALIGSTATATGLYRINVAGLKSVRSRVTWTSGTSVTVKAYTLPFAGAPRSMILLGKSTNAGDTALVCDSGGRLRVAIASSSGDAHVNAAALDGGASPGGAVWVHAAPQGWDGAAFARIRTPGTFKTHEATSITTGGTVWTPGVGKKFRLQGGIITASVDGDVVFKDNTGGSTILVVPVKAGVPVVFYLFNGRLSATANNVLTATLASGTLSGTLYGTEE